MLLITVTRLRKGYRLLATSSHRARYYCWSLYRNNALLAVISRNFDGESSINFDLFEPLAPGHYALRVECFDWPTIGQTTDCIYHTDIATVAERGMGSVDTVQALNLQQKATRRQAE